VFRSKYGCAALVVALLGGCAIVPNIPPDFALPVRDILAQSACELQASFNYLDSKPEFARFKAKQWLITLGIAPKVDTDLNAGGGGTRVSPYIGKPVRFTTWSVTGPGLQLDGKGERSSGISFTFTSSKLMTDKSIQCPPSSPSIHVLAQYLGVGEWLTRTAAALSVAKSAGIDKPIYDTDITVKFSANGTYSFTFPPGTDIASFGGSYMVDEQLNISMAPIADKTTLTVTSLPVGQQYSATGTSTVQLMSAQNRLDLLGIEQAIRKLQTND
jgi:hypothetical protein